ncbi:SGNH/GDSL hydrolase family protein [Streptomyces sp. NPDC050485]|uniref:SGNH/GDSL hydrolase family protein n=1 Tax=Streptomyces sp. NPDC050485 TaxID=3365617 RepID=UPI0037B0B55E
MKPRHLTAALAAASALLATPPTPAIADHHFREYVALGDSWSADVTVIGIDRTYAPTGCAQSSWNYPKQVAARLHVSAFRDATCGGATTADMTAPQNVPRVPLLADGVNPAQFDRLTRTTDLVTLGIGGNDVGLGTAVMGCLNPLPAPLGTPCRTRFTGPGGRDLMSQRIAAAKSKITGVIAGIRQRSPKARVLVVNYLAGVAVDRGCYPQVPIFDEDLTWLGARLRELNAMLATAAAESGAGFVDTYRGSVGHDVCQPPGKRWVEGVAPVLTERQGLGVPFHPNRLGADHQASTVLATLGS